MFGFDSRSVGRDPLRVERISELIEQVWARYPQLRLGQLLVNCCPAMDKASFHVEDDVLEEALEHVLLHGF